MAGSNDNDFEFLRVYRTKEKFHQLVAGQGSFKFETIDGGVLTSSWTAALKSESLIDKGTITTGDNLDNYINMGCYRYNGGPSNMPPDADWGLLCVFRAGNYTTQLAFAGCKKIYTRALVIGKPWTSWLQS